MKAIPDLNSIKYWHYPNNLPIRQYQLNIVKTCLFQNVLVSLPTGLGKTFIAAVAMYNYYLWFPHGKIVFMAPTRPLVAQQITACMKITGIPPRDCIELTGSIDPEKRKEFWNSKRLFFCTPQVLANDLENNLVPFDWIVMLVIDEAHKATGNYAYCQVVNYLGDLDYRILALTATPGSSGPAVQTIIDNLKISKIELRTEESMDVQAYIQTKSNETIEIPPSRRMLEVKEILQRCLMLPYVNRLMQAGAIFDSDLSKISTFTLIRYRESYRNKAGIQGQVEGDFAALMSLCHSNELLECHGIRPFYNQISKLLEDPAYKGRLKSDIGKCAEFLALLHSLKEEMQQPTFISHPKVEKLEALLLEYFTSSDGSDSSKVLVFSQYRESVMDIVERLKCNDPILRVASFIGQSSGKRSVGLKQKDQLKVLEDFRDSIYNVLVATSVGEEGLDICSVDLIVCFDTQSSPLRLLQRVGRTGRNRSGRIIHLVSANEMGKQKSTEKKYKAVQNAMSKGLKMIPSCRMIPSNVVPELLEREFVINEEKEEPELKKKKTKLSKSTEIAPLKPTETIVSNSGVVLHHKCRAAKDSIHKISNSLTCDSFLRLLNDFEELDSDGLVELSMIINTKGEEKEIPSNVSIMNEGKRIETSAAKEIPSILENNNLHLENPQVDTEVQENQDKSMQMMRFPFILRIVDFYEPFKDIPRFTKIYEPFENPAKIDKPSYSPKRIVEPFVDPTIIIKPLDNPTIISSPKKIDKPYDHSIVKNDGEEELGNSEDFFEDIPDDIFDIDEREIKEKSFDSSISFDDNVKPDSKITFIDCVNSKELNRSSKESPCNSPIITKKFSKTTFPSQEPRRELSKKPKVNMNRSSKESPCDSPIIAKKFSKTIFPSQEARKEFSKKPKVNMFLDIEAELSGQESEEFDEIDASFMNSFIDDQSQSQEADMRSIYLQSIQANQSNGSSLFPWRNRKSIIAPLSSSPMPEEEDLGSLADFIVDDDDFE